MANTRQEKIRGTMKVIDKDKVVSEIERLVSNGKLKCQQSQENNDQVSYIAWSEHIATLGKIISFLDTLEAKEAEEKFECPKVKIQDVIEVSSRMKYIDDDLKPIAEFIMNYASWNLYKDEWNQPVLEVPLFRVLDALAQRGKPYCCS